MEYLALSGGGINGIQHLGALKYLEYTLGNHSIYHHFKGFAGTSVGALIVFGLILNYKVSYLLKLFLDNMEILSNINVNTTRLSTTMAVQSNQPVRHILESLLHTRGHHATITFRELHQCTGKELSICCTNMNTCELKIFSDQQSPTTPVIDSLLASMAIPLICPLITIDGVPYADGGLVCNYPWVCYPLETTLGINILVKQLYTNPTESFSNLATQSIQAIFYSQTVNLRYLLKMNRASCVIQIQARSFPIPTEAQYDVIINIYSGMLAIHKRLDHPVAVYLTLLYMDTLNPERSGTRI